MRALLVSVFVLALAAPAASQTPSPPPNTPDKSITDADLAVTYDKRGIPRFIGIDRQALVADGEVGYQGRALLARHARTRRPRAVGFRPC